MEQADAALTALDSDVRDSFGGAAMQSFSSTDAAKFEGNPALRYITNSQGFYGVGPMWQPMFGSPPFRVGQDSSAVHGELLHGAKAVAGREDRKLMGKVFYLCPC